MNKVILNLEALRHNLQVIGGMMDRHGASWSVVTKALCGHRDTLRALHLLGARSVCDSRLDNLVSVREASTDFESWYLRLPHPSAVGDVVELADVSLNSEIEVIKALSREAVKRNKTHHIVIMIEMGDLREGILPGTLIRFYEDVFNLPNLEVLGIGAQIGCLAGTVPNIDQVSQLILYRELLELKFQRKMPMISGGSSIFLPLVQEGRMPRGVNHYRIGESLFLGTNLVSGGRLEGLRDDVVVLEAEVAEVKEKNLVPLGERLGTASSEDGADGDLVPGRRGYRALVTVGEIDTEVSGLTPLNPAFKIAGASSDVTVVNLGEQPDGLKVGSKIRFSCGYSAFVRLMNDPHIAKEVTPPLDAFAGDMPERWNLEVAKTIPREQARRPAGMRAS